MKNRVTLSSYWGKVTRPCLDQRSGGDVITTIAGVKLRFAHTRGDGLAELGLLQPTKKHNVVFVVVDEIVSTGKSRVLIGWKNPADVFVRRVQEHIASGSHSLFGVMSCVDPIWKRKDLKEIFNGGNS